MKEFNYHVGNIKFNGRQKVRTTTRKIQNLQHDIIFTICITKY